MITCSKCGKDNQDHYKFCLGCGAELPRGEAAAKQFKPEPSTGRTGSPAGIGDPFAAPAGPAADIPAPPAFLGSGQAGGSWPAGGASPAPAAPAQAGGPCPQCSQTNPPGMRFCMSCGFNLASANVAPPVAAAPAPVAAPIAAPVAPTPAPIAAPAAAAVQSGGQPVAMLTALRADKSEVGSHPIGSNTTVGRDTGGIFAGDSYLSPRHATFVQRSAKQITVRDEGSLNGTFYKLTPEVPVELRPGDVFRIGQEIIRFEQLVPQPPSPDGVERLGSPSKGYVGRLALIIGRDVTGNAFPVPEAGVQLGRERGEILFPEDGYVSGLHCRIARGADGKTTLTDLGSSNGTFVRLNGERELRSGDEILMGQQLFRLTLL